MAPLPNISEDLRPLRVKKSPTEQEESPTLKFDLVTYQLRNSDPEVSETPLAGTIEFCFNGGTVSKGTDEVNIIGSFPLFLQPGQMKSQDMDFLAHEHAQDELNQWLNESGAAEGSRVWTKAHNAQIPLKTAFLLPGIKLEQGKELLLIHLLQLVLEDAFEQYKAVGVDFDQFMDVSNTIVSICLGENYDPDFGAKTTFPNFAVVNMLCQKLRGMFEIRGLEAAKHVIFDLTEYIETSFWEMDEWWADCPSHKARPKTFYFMRKEKTHGLKTVIELVCFLEGVTILPKVRRDPLFELMKRLLTKVVVSVEAVLSLRKAIEDNVTDNCVLLRTRKKTLHEALKRTLVQIRETIQDFAAFETQLNIKFEGTKCLEGFQKFCFIGKALVDAQIQYLLVSKIHGDFDVVVELNLEKLDG